MTIHLLFVTITIERRTWTMEEIKQEQLIRQVEEEMMDRKCSVYRLF
ncbi:YrzI family small protein [Geobacillus vulcani]|nr:YrzI family small protein [Geobacillus vulcani]